MLRVMFTRGGGGLGCTDGMMVTVSSLVNCKSISMF